jgi:hypothetical protein
MSDDRPNPRGEAAWKAEKQRIAERNEAAYARGRRERAARDADAARQRLEADRRDVASRPQPGGR